MSTPRIRGVCGSGQCVASCVCQHDGRQRHRRAITRAYGAGFANAVFDAVGVRLRHAPLSRQRLLMALVEHEKVWAFALVGVAAMLRLGTEGEQRIEAARLVLSGVAPIPWRAMAAEQVLIGAKVNDALFAPAAEVALTAAEPLHHNTYKIPLARALIRRGLATLTVRATTG